VCKNFPPSAMPVTDGATVYVKDPGRAMDGEITAIYLKKQIAPPGAEDREPHMRHWWLMFQVRDETWMQVDLIQEKYRIIWDARFEEAEGIGFDRKVVPPGLTSQKVVAETKKIAMVENTYYNPRVPDPRYRRFSCHDFAILLADRLDMTL